MRLPLKAFAQPALRRQGSEPMLKHAGLVAGVMVIALLAAAALAFGQFILAALLGAILLAPMSVAIFVRAFGTRHDVLFWGLVLAMFGTSLASSVLQTSLSSISSGLLLLCAPMIALSVLPAMRNSLRIRWVVALLVAFYLIAMLSSIWGRSLLVPAVYTAIMSLKPFLYMGLGAALLWTPTSERVFQWMLRWIWLPLIVLVALQWLAPGAYSAFFTDRDTLAGSNPFVPGVPRAYGTFSHPAVLAAVAGCLALISFVNAMFGRNSLRMLATCAVYLFLVIAAGQRQELAACLIALLVAFAVARWRLSFRALALVAVLAILPVGGVMFLVIPEVVDRELANFGLLPAFGDLSARAVLYNDAVGIANRYWPLGSGFGTFASIGSVRFDQSQFYELGYRTFWWFKSQSYLQDAFWSRYIAETGWLGTAACLMVYAVVLQRLTSWQKLPLVARDVELHRRVVCAIVGMTYLLLVSPTGNAPAEAHGGLFALVYVGIAWNQIRAAQRSGVMTSGAQQAQRASAPSHAGVRKGRVRMAVAGTGERR